MRIGSPHPVLVADRSTWTGEALTVGNLAHENGLTEDDGSLTSPIELT